MNMEENIMPVNGAAVTVPWFTIRKKEIAITVRHPAAAETNRSSGEKSEIQAYIQCERCRENAG